MDLKNKASSFVQEGDAVEQCEIYKASKNDQHLILNDQISFSSNALFDTAKNIQENEF